MDRQRLPRSYLLPISPTASCACSYKGLCFQYHLTDADIAFLGMVHTSDDVDGSSCWVGHYKGIRKPWASWAARQIRVTNASPSRGTQFLIEERVPRRQALATLAAPEDNLRRSARMDRWLDNRSQRAAFAGRNGNRLRRPRRGVRLAKVGGEGGIRSRRTAQPLLQPAAICRTRVRATGSVACTTPPSMPRSDPRSARGAPGRRRRGDRR